MDAADIWSTAYCSNVTFQAQGGCSRTNANDITGKLGHHAQRSVPGRIRRHIPRCCGTLIVIFVLAWLIREPLIKVTIAPRKMPIVPLLDGRVSRRGCSLHLSPSRRSGWVACSRDFLYLLRQSIAAENSRCTCCQRASRVRGLRRAGKGSFFGLGSTGAH
jgi:hypothetical protein